MSESSPQSEHLQHVESVAALGYLLNAIAHDLNNLLTNLMLGADQVQYGGGAEAVELLVEQVQRITGITRSIQKLGQRSMNAAPEDAQLSSLLEELVVWHDAVSPRDVPTLVMGEDAALRLNRRHLVHGLSLLCGATAEHHPGAALTVSAGKETVPRSAWAGSTDTVTMAVIRVRRGSPSNAQSQDFKRLVDGFFEGDRSAHEVATMAAWEVVRKLRGRMKVRGGAGDLGTEFTLELPLAEGA